MVGSKAILDRPMYFEEGGGVRSLKAQNRELALWLPQRNSGSYQAITDYMKFMLGKFGTRAVYPTSPEPSEIHLLPDLDSGTIPADSSVFGLHLEPPSPSHQTINLLPRQDASWITYRRIFLQDLTRFGIPRATLAWESPVTFPWNKMMLAFLVKHWRWAMSQGAFSRYSVDSTYSTDAICQAAMERWFRGRVSKEGKYRSRKMKNQRRATIFCYRQDALEEFCELEDRDLLSTALSFLPSASCCSDTEDDGPGKPRAVGMVWRSQEYSELLHLLDSLSFNQQKALHGARWGPRRLDMRRGSPIKTSSRGKVPRNLPSNCYCPVWKEAFGESHKQLLTQKAASPALPLLISKIRSIV
ncbi:uncharacterized protein MELLADRAFT_61026 [Melampsora larici-populina 98AG31]|uniref:Uncharacterized protein n=1 Tax=Melampsora larici-populina (strain 98AG31 / pathotype 3-4-7) TaxID=747676 RepID=F4RDB4_MELLP|nr:uncharacterized protein MELLADRAFT_61026 [Melampsora larici-populina 98AG31]EGG09638.1 hypothetical protein MELLADRAFT_61026 [Melampsora larici-populina 98AG31]